MGQDFYRRRVGTAAIKRRCTPTLAAAAALALALLLAACVSPVPTEQIALGSAAVDAARSAGAEQHAGPEFATARQKLENARTQVGFGDNVQARWLAEEAEVDAQVALSRAAAQRSQLAAAEVEAGLRALREALGRGEPDQRNAMPQPVMPPRVGSEQAR